MNIQDSISCLFVVLHTGESGVEEWSQWSTCSVTCGQGSQVRTRTCVSPYGTHCSGPLRESRVCNNTALCPGSVSSNYNCGCYWIVSCYAFGTIDLLFSYELGIDIFFRVDKCNFYWIVNFFMYMIISAFRAVKKLYVTLLPTATKSLKFLYLPVIVFKFQSIFLF